MVPNHYLPSIYFEECVTLFTFSSILSRKIHARVTSTTLWKGAVRDYNHQQRMQMLIESVLTSAEAMKIAMQLEWIQF